MSTFLKTLSVVLTVCALSYAAMQYEIQDLTGGKSFFSNAKVQSLVGTSLNSEIASQPYLKALVKIYANTTGTENSFIVYLQRSDMYFFKCYKLDVQGSAVSKVYEDFVEEEKVDERVCSVCPNPNVEAIMSWILDFPTSISNGRNCVKAMRDGGLVADTLPGAKESMTAIQNYLKCPKLKMWVRIGHGSTSSILLGGGQSFTTSSITTNKAAMKNKIFIFNSCLCHGSPFEPAMIAAGVYFYAAGDISLTTNKEQVVTYFVNHAVKNKEQLDASMTAATKEASYLNAWGQSGAGVKPWLFANSGDGTSIENNSVTAPTVHRYDFYVSVNPNKVSFLNATGSMISIYTLSGKLVYQKSSLKEWNMTSSNGQKVNAGSYIAVADYGNKTVKQSFTIMK